MLRYKVEGEPSAVYLSMLHIYRGSRLTFGIYSGPFFLRVKPKASVRNVLHSAELMDDSRPMIGGTWP